MANDLSAVAVQDTKDNAALNSIFVVQSPSQHQTSRPKLLVCQEDATSFFMERPGSFDVIDLDPFGSVVRTHSHTHTRT